MSSASPQSRQLWEGDTDLCGSAVTSRAALAFWRWQTPRVEEARARSGVLSSTDESLKDRLGACPCLPRDHTFP